MIRYPCLPNLLENMLSLSIKYDISYRIFINYNSQVGDVSFIPH